MQPIGAVTKKEPKTDLRMQPIGAVTKKEPKTETALRTVSAGVKRKQSDVIPIGAVPSAGIQCKRSDVIPIGAVPSAGVQCKRSNGIPIQAVPSAGVECKRSDVIPIGAVRKYQPSHTTPIGAATNRQHVDMKSANAEEIPHGRLRVTEPPYPPPWLATAGPPPEVLRPAGPSFPPSWRVLHQREVRIHVWGGQADDRDLDYVVDCRCFSDPGHDPSLRSHSGHHDETLASVSGHKLFTKEVDKLLRFLVQFQGPVVQLGFFCRAGKHRSVAMSWLTRVLVQSLGAVSCRMHYSRQSSHLCWSCARCREDTARKSNLETELAEYARERIQDL